MSRPKGAGTVVQIGKLYYARKRRVGHKDAYGPPRNTRLEANNDLPHLKFPDVPKVGVMPTSREWAERMMAPDSEFSKSINTERGSTWDTNETIRVAWWNKSRLGKKPLDKVSRRDAQAFIDGIQRSASYVRRIGAFGSRMFALAASCEEQWVEKNPFWGVKYPEVEERDNRTLSPREVLGLLNPSTRFQCMVTVGAFTGMRRDEVCSLKWENIRDDYIKVTGTKGAKLTANVPLTPEVQAAIDIQPRVMIGKSKWSPYVFTVAGGGKVAPHNFTRDFRKWKKGLGIPPETRLQDLRGTYASLLIETGANIREVQELLRHKDPRTTLKMYARSRNETKRAAVDKFRDAVLGSEPEQEAKKA